MGAFPFLCRRREIPAQFETLFKFQDIQLDRFSIDPLSKVIAELLWFCFTTLCDWFRKLAPPIQPIRYKTKTNRDLVTRFFPRLALVTCIWSKLSLVHFVGIGHWNYIWFWFYDTRYTLELYILITANEDEGFTSHFALVPRMRQNYIRRVLFKLDRRDLKMANKLTHWFEIHAVFHGAKLSYKNAIALLVTSERQVSEWRPPLWRTHRQYELFAGSSLSYKEGSWFHHRRQCFLSLYHCDLFVVIWFIAYLETKDVISVIENHTVDHIKWCLYVPNRMHHSL